MAEYESRKVIRYSKEMMIQLHDSPLVKKPDSLPCLSTWFGEDPGSPILKNILNGSNISRTHSNGVSTDKNILLCPQKANFVSSLYGGFKKNDDNNSMKHTRHKIDSNSNNNNNSNRNPRSFMGEKGLNNSSNSNKSKYMNASPHKRYNNNTSNKRDNHYHSQHHHNQSSSNRMRMDEHNTNNYNERVPEWLDYNPESKDQQQQQQQQQQKEVTNDLELWKSTMKKRDGLEESKSFVDKSGQKETEQAFSFLSLDQKNGFDDFFVKETELLTPRRENQTGSRFAKFFAKREGEEDQHQAPAAEPKSISINDLFQGVQQQQQLANNNEVHVLSEDDILQSLGAKKNNSNKPAGAGDAIGFNRVLQILSQPKPTISSPTATAASATTTANSNSAPDSYMIESNNKENQQNMPPAMTSTTTATTNTAGITTATPTAAATTAATSTPVSDVPSATTATTEVKASGNSKPSTPIMSSRFGNNLPTAVLRQMSARSSPSLQTSKSTHTANYSTATTSAAAVARNSPIKQPIHQPIQQYPSVFPYQQPPYSPHQQMMEMFPMNGGMPPPRANGNPEQFLPPHMMMQPPPLPPPNAAQRPMMPPHPFLQGQFHIQRDMMQPMPPYVITNGIPPHQMFNKNQGWERQ